ncbi:MAG: ISAs1 family transposase [Trueperaceae bacterium]|nr:ISAs1 family transposase [Trueperaceae bacterium]
MKVLDKRDEKRCQYSFEMLFKLVLMAISAKPENILAMSQWIEDNASDLFALGFKNQRGEERLPSQATLYRFFWALEERIDDLEHQLSRWAIGVLESIRLPGEIIRMGVDGKQVRGSKRVPQGEKAYCLLSCFVHEIGLSLKQCVVTGDEAKAALKLLSSLTGLESMPWLFTGDAAFAERPLVETVLDKGGMYLFDLKDNLSDVKANAQWAFSLPRCEQDSFFEDSEVRSGELWLREIETRPASPELSNDFPAATQFIRCIRTVISKATGEIRFTETEYALTSTFASADKLYTWWRGHWQIENCSHHKRDTIWREDACRTRKASHAFAALRNLLLSLFHLNGFQVLRHARKCNAQPIRAFELLGFDS